MSAGESARAKAASLRTEASRWDAGAEGEERVGAVLDVAGDQTFRVLHDRLSSPGKSEANLDHLVVCASGIFLIDTKNWKGTVQPYNGSLFQHLGAANDRQSASKYADLQIVRGTAEKVSRAIGHRVIPVLCLAGDQSTRFGPAAVLSGVHVVPVESLVAWLQSQPGRYNSNEVTTIAVDLSCRFPPALDSGHTMAFADAALVHEPSHVARGSASPTVGRRPSRRHAPRRQTTGSGVRTGPKAVKIVVAMLAVLVSLTVGPKLIASIADHAASGLTGPTVRARPSSTQATAPSTSLSAARLQELDDWRIRAGLYESNEAPTVLAYVPDASLGSYADICARQVAQLAPYRAHLLAAPDPQLKTWAAKFDAAARSQLTACMRNDPVSLHHARTAMATAATAINAHYDQLLGQSPSAYNATRVL